MIGQSILTVSLIHSLYMVGRMCFFDLGVKGLKSKATSKRPWKVSINSHGASRISSAIVCLHNVSSVLEFCMWAASVPLFLPKRTGETYGCGMEAQAGMGNTSLDRCGLFQFHLPSKLQYAVPLPHLVGLMRLARPPSHAWFQSCVHDSPVGALSTWAPGFLWKRPWPWPVQVVAG